MSRQLDDASDDGGCEREMPAEDGEAGAHRFRRPKTRTARGCWTDLLAVS